MAAAVASMGDAGPAAAAPAVDMSRPPAVCVTCRNDEFVSHNSGEGRLEIFKCAACDKYFTRQDVDKFLEEWEASLKKTLGADRTKKKKFGHGRVKTPEHLIPLCPDSECGGYMKSWRGSQGVDEVFRCDECCRPFFAKEVEKRRAVDAAAKKAAAANAETADTVIEPTAAGFDMADLDAPERDED